jgi:hypothetical protein
MRRRFGPRRWQLASGNIPKGDRAGGRPDNRTTTRQMQQSGTSIKLNRSLDDWRPLLVRRLRANCPEERDIIDFPTRDTNQYSRRRCEMTPATIKFAILVLAIPLILPAARYSLAQIRTGGESGSHLSQYCVPPEETLDTRNFYCRGMTKRTVPDAAYLTNPKGDDHEGKSISVALKKAVPTLRRLWRCARLELLDCCWHPFE